MQATACGLAPARYVQSRPARLDQRFPNCRRGASVALRRQLCIACKKFRACIHGGGIGGARFFRQRAGYSRRKPAGFQGNSTFYGGKRPAQTMCNACEYSFLYIGYVARGKRPRSIGESPPEGFRLWWSFPFSRGGTPPPGRLGFLPMIPQIPAHGNTQEGFFARAAGARLSPARNCQHRFLLKWGARWCILYAVYVQVRPQ